MSKEVNECWSWLKKFGTEDLRIRFRPVYVYIQRLEKRIAELEKMHDAHMAPQMFKNPQDKEFLVKIQAEKLKQQLNEPKQYFPLKIRLKNMIEEGLQGSDLWLKTLKWNRLTNEEATRMANEN